MRSLMAFATRNLPRTPAPTPSVRKVGPDFHLAELTERGYALAGGAPLRISNGRISIVFPADGTPVKVAQHRHLRMRVPYRVCGLPERRMPGGLMGT